MQGSRVLVEQIRVLVEEVSLLKQYVLQPQEPELHLPDRFSGDRRQFFAFMESCKLYFRIRPRSSGSEEPKVGVIISLLQGDPQVWAFSLPADSPTLHSVENFFSALALLYGDPDKVALAENKIRRIRQGNRPAEDYCTEFRSWCTNTQWNDSALASQFCLGLSNKIKDMLVYHPAPRSLEEAMSLSIRLDRRIRDRYSEAVFQAETIPVRDNLFHDSEEPMQINTLVSAGTRRVKRLQEGLCLYCGQKGHFLRDCPVLIRRKPAQKSRGSGDENGDHPQVTIATLGSPKFFVPTEILCSNMTVKITACVDSGAGANLINRKFAESVGLKFASLTHPVKVLAMDSTPLGQRHIDTVVENVAVNICASHREILTFYVLDSLPADVLLGMPWLVKNNPIIDWQKNEIVGWGQTTLTESGVNKDLQSSPTSEQSPAMADAGLSSGSLLAEASPASVVVGDLRVESRVSSIESLVSTVESFQETEIQEPPVISSLHTCTVMEKTCDFVKPASVRRKDLVCNKRQNKKHLSKFPPRRPSPLPPSGDSSPQTAIYPGVIVDLDVERTIESKMVNGSLQCLVQWRGYGRKSRTWVSSKDLSSIFRGFTFYGRTAPGGPRVLGVRRPPVKEGVMS